MRNNIQNGNRMLIRRQHYDYKEKTKDDIINFTDEEKENIKPFENYSSLDDLGRCGVAFANICKELMPTEEREPIGQIKPSGWYGVILYNRL